MRHLSVLLLALMTLLSLVSCQTPASGATATPDASSAPDEDDWAYIREKGALIIGYTLYEPMNYMDGDTLTGFDTEFAQVVCERLGLEPVFTLIVWETKEAELEAKTIDCIWNGMTIDEERLQNMNISRPYVKNKQVVVIRRENAELYTDTASLAGKTIAAEAGSAGEKVVKENADLSKGTLVPVLQQTDALLEVKAGTSDAAVLDYVMAKAMVGEGTDYADLQIVEGLELAVEEYGIGFRKNSTATAQVNAVIEELIADGTLQALADKYDVNLAD
jgi:polar amino acid transport system substrate-binding protein